MAKFCSLFSGSSGNSTYIENGSDAVLVDIGVSAKRLTQALSERELDLSKIRAVFITHEHIDHIKGIRVFCSKNNIPVYLTQGTFNSMSAKGVISEKVDYKILGNEIDLGSIGMNFFHTSHDTAESCGFSFDLGTRKICTCTDLGFVSEEVHSSLEGADLVMLESNHDVEMLKQNPHYPFQLKRRILSQNGHLSNNACAEEAVKLINTGTTRLVLAHLSAENNLPIKAKKTTERLLDLDAKKESVDYLLSVSAPIGNDTIII